MSGYFKLHTEVYMEKSNTPWRPCFCKSRIDFQISYLYDWSISDYFLPIAFNPDIGFSEKYVSNTCT